MFINELYLMYDITVLSVSSSLTSQQWDNVFIISYVFTHIFYNYYQYFTLDMVVQYNIHYFYDLQRYKMNLTFLKVFKDVNLTS